ncbi:Alpha-galactosidase [Diplonema papillatum]|nr:Alpha-galactosidase [Diplonema papillatum]|eukprot:gene9398-14575_t
MRLGHVFALAALAAHPAACIDNGYGLRPPMGWRSWNAYGLDITQDVMEATMDAMAAKPYSVDGVPTSLVDLGYVSAGLDDAWQACGTGYLGGFHDEDGNPLVNATRFPSMKAMTDHGHALGMKVGWYMNNCHCREKQYVDQAYIEKHMINSTNAVAEYGFDGLKLDNCGEFTNLTWWAGLLNATGRPVMIENCHWGSTVPGQTSGEGPCTGTTMPSDCPYNFFRTSQDIKAFWVSMMHNLQSTVPYSGHPPLSRPGAWAYPDMLEVGRLASHIEDRTHFGAWCIISAPLILGHNVTDTALTGRIWDIVANKELIAVNQDWAGHPGSRVYGENFRTAYQVWMKPLTGGDAAVLVINSDAQPGVSVRLQFSDFGLSGSVSIRDLYSHSNVGAFVDSFTTPNITLHDSTFYRLTPQQ